LAAAISHYPARERVDGSRCRGSLWKDVQMKYVHLRPDVAGELGEDTVMDVSVHPPKVSRLHYEFEDWDGDVLVTTFPCYLITADAMDHVITHDLTGASFTQALVTTTETLPELKPHVRLPKFVWLKVHGTPGVDDFGLEPPAKLIVSERALELLAGLGLPHAEVSRWR
jgi:hypothetical protein